MLATNKNGTGSPMIAESMAKNIIRHKDKLIEQQQADLLTLADAVLKYSCGYDNEELNNACQIARRVKGE